MAERFAIRIHGEWAFTAEEIWPDGDGPEKPTVHDVAARLREEGLEFFLRQWWGPGGVPLGRSLGWTISGVDGHTSVR